MVSNKVWFGEYLCQHDVLTREELISALSAYYSSRAPIGRLALQSKLLSLREVQQVLSYQADHPAPFGETAVQLGFLQEEQVEMLIGRQWFKESIWQFLVKQNFLPEQEMNEWMIKFHREHSLQQLELH